MVRCKSGWQQLWCKEETGLEGHQGGFKYDIEGERRIGVIKVSHLDVKRVLKHYDNSGWGAALEKKWFISFLTCF